MKLLVVEDEVKLAEYLRKGLSEEGYTVDVAHTGSARQRPAPPVCRVRLHLLQRVQIHHFVGVRFAVADGHRLAP